MTPRSHIPRAVRKAVDAREACEACGGPGPFERDHRHAVALGGGNELDNLALLCIGCHAEKTRRDVKAIAKAKRIARKLAGTWPKHGRKLQSRGFDKRLRKKLDGTVEARE